MEGRDAHGRFIKGHVVSEEVRCKESNTSRGVPKPSVSTNLKKYFSNPENRQKVRDKQLELHAEHPEMFDSFETATKMRRQGLTNPSCMRGKKQTEEAKRKIGVASKRSWQDPEYPWNNMQFREEVGAKILKANCMRPTKPEKQVIRILKALSSNIKYVGDGKRENWISGKNPDFINKDKKQIIEVFGCFWHCCKKCGHLNKASQRQKDASRISKFEELGYSVIVIWEHELSNLKVLTKKLTVFTGG